MSGSGVSNQSSYGNYNNNSNNSSLNSGGGYQRMGTGGHNPDGQRKSYSHSTSPGHGYGESSPPPYKRNRKDWEMNPNESSGGRSGGHDSMYGSGNAPAAYQHSNYNPMNQQKNQPQQQFSNQSQ